MLEVIDNQNVPSVKFKRQKIERRESTSNILAPRLISYIYKIVLLINKKKKDNLMKK